MAQGYLFKTTLLHGTILLCVPLFLSLPQTDAHAAQAERNPTAASYSSGTNAYRARRIKARAESYQERKQFPPSDIKAAEKLPEPVENKYAEPLKVTIPNLVESPVAERRDTQIVTRSAPAYKYLAAAHSSGSADTQRLQQDAPIYHQLAEAGGAVASSIASAGQSLIANILPTSSERVADDVHVSLPTVEVAEASQTPAPQQATDIPPPVAKQPQDVKPETPAEEKPFRYYSPGIVIKKEVVRLPVDPEVLASASPEQLARLAPAAGEAPSGMDAPLIQIPASETSASEPEKPAPPAVTSPVAPDQPAVAAPEITPLVAPVDIPVQAEPPALKAEDVEKVKEIVQNVPSDSGQSAPAKTLPQLEAPPVIKATAPTKEPQAAVIKPSPAPEKTTEETPTDLSPKSKKILEQLPSIADEKPKEPNGLDIDRSKQTENLFDANVQEADASLDADGIQIEVKTPSMNVNYELEKAYNALLSGQNSAAIQIYKGVLINDPINEDALFGLATTYHRAGQIEAARPLYGKLLSRNPTHRAALNNFLVLVADESPQEALIQLEALEKKSPDFSPIPAQMAVIYQKAGDLGKASEKMFKAVSLAPENLTYRYNLAILMDKQRNFEEATRLYGQIVQAHSRGETTPGNINRIQERLTFLRSNKH